VPNPTALLKRLQVMKWHHPSQYLIMWRGSIWLMSSKLMNRWQRSYTPWAAWTCSAGRTTASEICPSARYHTGICNRYKGFVPRSNAGNLLSPRLSSSSHISCKTKHATKSTHPYWHAHPQWQHANIKPCHLDFWYQGPATDYTINIYQYYISVRCSGCSVYSFYSADRHTDNIQTHSVRQAS